MKKVSALKVADVIVKVLVITLLVLYCITLLLPLIWMFYTSFKGNVEYLLDTFRLPEKWYFTNYADVWNMLEIKIDSRHTYNIVSMLATSFLWAGGNALLSVLLTTMMAYIVSRYSFPGRDFIYALGIFVMITPIVGSLPSAMLIRKRLLIYDNILFTILTNPSASFSGLYFMLLYAAFKRVPWAFAESVFIDGGGHYRVFFSIMMPIMMPTCIAIFVLSFIGTWNDYMSFMIWLPSYANLAYGMYLFQSEASAYEATMPQILAGFVIVMIPTVILYVAFQNIILSKFSVGGLKG